MGFAAILRGTGDAASYKEKTGYAFQDLAGMVDKRVLSRTARTDDGDQNSPSYSHL